MPLTFPVRADRKSLAFAAMLAGNACLAFGPWLVRLAREPGGVGPIAAGFWRLALAAPILVAMAWATRKSSPKRGGGRSGDQRHAGGMSQPRSRLAQRAVAAGWWRGLSTRAALRGEPPPPPATVPLPVPGRNRSLHLILMLGGLFFALDLAAWHAGILRTRLANATLFGNTSSFLFAIYGFVVARRRPGRTQLAALGLAAAGTALLLGRSYELSSRNFAGDLLCILAGLFYLVYLIAVDRARATLRPLPVLAASTVAGLAPLLLLALALEGRVLPHHWGALIGLALGSQVAGQGLIVFAIGELSPLVIGLGLLTQPVTAALIGWIVYGEALTALDLAGAVAIGIALILVRRQVPSPPSPLSAAAERLSSGP